MAAESAMPSLGEAFGMHGPAASDGRRKTIDANATAPIVLSPLPVEARRCIRTLRATIEEFRSNEPIIPPRTHYQVEGYMSRSSNNLVWSGVALTTLLIVFSMPFEAAAQQPRLILPPSSIRTLPSTPPATADATAFSLHRLTQPVEVRHSSKATRATIVALAAVGGFFGGAYAGAFLENQVAPCGCDDPGRMGAVIGAPIGAFAAAVLTFRLLPKPGGSRTIPACKPPISHQFSGRCLVSSPRDRRNAAVRTSSIRETSASFDRSTTCRPP